MKIVFMGTPEFAVPSLKLLIENFKVEAVFTQPDRPKGRGKKVSMSPVKEIAVQYGIPVFQPIKLKNDKESIQALKDIAPDFIIVVAFGQLLPKEVLDIPRYGCINLHASLLPKLRGAAPINWAIINGEEVTGNTTMLMDIGLDTGNILLREEVTITDNMTSGELHDILMQDGGKLLIETINGIVQKEIKPIKQNDEESSYAPMLNKQIARINWSKPAEEIKNLVNGLNPWPIAYTSYNNEVMKVLQVEVFMESCHKAPGTILEVNKSGIKVAAGKGSVLIKILQFPGGKPLKVEEYIKGNQIEEGVLLI